MSIANSDNVDELVRCAVAAAPSLGSSGQALAVSLYRALADDTPVDPAELARRLGQPEEAIRDTLASWPGVFSQRGRVVAFWGLSLVEMDFGFEVSGVRLFTWCAWDPLFIAPILGSPGRVEGRCPVTGQQVTFTVGSEGVSDLSPPAAVMSFLAFTGRWHDDVITSFCHFVRLFASEEAGRTWVAEHPGTVLLSLSEGFELGRRWTEARFGTALATSS